LPLLKFQPSYFGLLSTNITEHIAYHVFLKVLALYFKINMTSLLSVELQQNPGKTAFTVRTEMCL